MKILVTGASGFVGGRFLEMFPEGPDLVVRGVSRRLPRVGVGFRADLSRPFDLPFDPDVVIHAAARASPWGTKAEFEAQNVGATAEVIRFCRAKGHPRLVYVSSSSVFYNHKDQFNLTEDSPIGPRFVNEYARTKAAGEALVRAYPGPWVIVRPRAVFGPGDTVLFPRILEASRRGSLPRLVRKGAPAVGDLIYIDSLCQYLMEACVRPVTGQSYNLTNAQPVAILGLLETVLVRLGLPPPTRNLGVGPAMVAATLLEGVHRLLRLPGEPMVTPYGVGVLAYSKTFDVSRALKDLGPPSVGLEEGLERFLTWQASR